MNPKRVHHAIQYLVGKSARPLLKTQIVKVLYLADIESMLLHGDTITGVRYVKDYQGPNAPGIERAAGDMLGHEIAVQECVSSSGHLYYRHSPGPSPRFEADLEPRHTRLLDYVLAKFGAKPLDDLKRAAYCTLPWLRAIHQGLKTALDLGVVRTGFAPTKVDRGWVRARIQAAEAHVRPQGTPEDQAESLVQVFEETAPLRQAANTVMFGDSQPS
jgi:hypothetical protein